MSLADWLVGNTCSPLSTGAVKSDFRSLRKLDFVYNTPFATREKLNIVSDSRIANNILLKFAE
jgi:hypothetical protein